MSRIFHFRLKWKKADWENRRRLAEMAARNDKADLLLETAVTLSLVATRLTATEGERISIHIHI